VLRHGADRACLDEERGQLLRVLARRASGSALRLDVETVEVGDSHVSPIAADPDQGRACQALNAVDERPATERMPGEQVLRERDPVGAGPA
jgi:hypothetical protein